jgi:hypothetical protein
MSRHAVRVALLPRRVSSFVTLHEHWLPYAQWANYSHQGFSMQRLLIAVALTVFSGSALAEYSFKLSNNTASKIVGIEVSDDGESWGKFDIGSGIKAGTTSTLVWDASTDEGACEWTFRAKFADGSESEDVDFDFCEEDLELEFN